MKLVIDLETNGLNNNYSVLSFSFIIINESNNIEFKDTRYYYPVENYQHKAININGLNKEKVDLLRGDSDYPKYFKDNHILKWIFENYKIDILIAHNINCKIKSGVKNIKKVQNFLIKHHKKFTHMSIKTIILISKRINGTALSKGVVVELFSGKYIDSSLKKTAIHYRKNIEILDSILSE